MHDTIAQRKARAIERLTNDRNAAIKRAEAAEGRAAALESNNDEMQDYINEIRVALHTEKDELTIDAAKRIVAERDEARKEIDRLRRFLQIVVNLGDTKKHAAFDGERHREMRHCANQALMTRKEEYEP